MTLSDFGKERDNRTDATDVKRNYHNQLERKRRDTIRLKFEKLQETIPVLKASSMSRCQMLKETIAYIQKKKHVNSELREVIKMLDHQNELLQNEISEKKNIADSNENHDNNNSIHIDDGDHYEDVIIDSYTVMIVE